MWLNIIFYLEFNILLIYDEKSLYGLIKKEDEDDLESFKTS